MNTARETIGAVVGGRLAYEDGLDILAVAPAAVVDPALTGALFDATARLWRGGWQPAELHRVVTRRGTGVQPALIADAAAAYLRDFPARAVDERWRAQAADLDAPDPRPADPKAPGLKTPALKTPGPKASGSKAAGPKTAAWWGDDAGYLGAVATRRRVDRVALLDAVLALLGLLAELPPIEVLVPPPGQAASRRPPGNDAKLERVRALLAKAEATGFPAEAEAYTAKAQELISRHSLDEALLTAGSATVVPYARRIGVDHPYESEKASLLSSVARANRCHVVWSPEFGFATVFGFDADIDAVDLLHTSLLVQAHRAMARSEPPGGKAGRARLKTFRQSFLVGYAVRIGERLAEASRAALAQTGDTAALLPVLASRDVRVQEARDRSFPHTVRGRGFRVHSHEGWESGRAAADQAKLR